MVCQNLFWKVSCETYHVLYYILAEFPSLIQECIVLWSSMEVDFHHFSKNLCTEIGNLIFEQFITVYFKTCCLDIPRTYILLHAEAY